MNNFIIKSPIQELTNSPEFQEYTNARNKFLDGLFTECTLPKEDILIFISNNDILPYGSYYNDSPKCFGEKFGQNQDYKYDRIDFSLYTQGKQAYGDFEESVFDAESYEELLNDIGEYVETSRTIGTHFDG